jgi:polyribonucleotide nucleotidyltransferase
VVPEKCDDAQDMKHPGPVNFRSGSTKLGDVVTAKVYQIRAYGLVLELSDGVHGMHKFQVTYNDQRKQADPFYVVAALSLYFISIDLCHWNLEILSQASGEKDFEVGEELVVKCESFNAKGIPIFSLVN